MKNSKLVTLSTLIVASLAFASLASAAVTQNSKVDTSEFSNRSEKKLGAYLGILGDPHPTVLGFNAAYNLADFLRLSAGFGQVSATVATLDNQGNFSTDSKSLTTIGFGTKFMVPGWNLTPTVGLGYSHLFMSQGISIADDYKANNLYTGIGVDWQAEGGFNLAGGVNVSLNNAAPTAPYINVGYFFY